MTGRPPQYNNCIDFDSMCELYFESCDDATVKGLSNSGELADVPQPEPYLKSGLALFLEITTQTMLVYSKDNDCPFSSIIKRAYDRIQNGLEKRSIMHGKQAVGCLFNLKCNFGMIETTKLEHSTNPDKPMKWEVEIVRPKDIEGE